MRWLVGVDLRQRSGGAVAFARGLVRHGKGHQAVAAHVIEDHARAVLSEYDPKAAEVLPERVESLLEPLSSDATFRDVGSIPATAAEDGLAVAARENECDGYILGRRVPAQGRGLVRLGRVARRMLRTLELPTIVVPPDLGDDLSLDGPILLATALSESCAGAASLAAYLGQSLDVDVLATTIVPSRQALAPYLWIDGEVEVSEAALRPSREAQDVWLSEHGLGDARRSVVEGSAEAQILDIAKVSGASMIVIGSRRLTTAERIFTSSLGSDLGAFSPIPVAVVPPSWRA